MNIILTDKIFMIQYNFPVYTPIVMPVTLKIHRFKVVPAQCLAFVADAVNVAMNEVVHDDNPGIKTFVTDGLATCAAVAFGGSDLGHSTAFTHMSSASTTVDDLRKEEVLNQMLALVLKKNKLADIKLFVSPSTIKENHLVNFLIIWAKKKNIQLNLLSQGGDSAIFNIDDKGNPLMISTSLVAKAGEVTKDKKWSGHGVVTALSNNQLFLAERTLVKKTSKTPTKNPARSLTKTLAKTPTKTPVKIPTKTIAKALTKSRAKTPAKKTTKAFFAPALNGAVLSREGAIPTEGNSTKKTTKSPDSATEGGISNSVTVISLNNTLSPTEGNIPQTLQKPIKTFFSPATKGAIPNSVAIASSDSTVSSTEGNAPKPLQTAIKTFFSSTRDGAVSSPELTSTNAILLVNKT